MKKLKVLYLPIWYPHEADPLAGNFIQDLARDLASEQLEIDVFYPNLTYKQSKSHIITNRHGHLTEHIANGWAPPKVNMVGLNIWIRKSLKIAKTVLQKEYDIIHTHGYVAAFLGPTFQKIFGGKLITTIHHSDFIENRVSGSRKKKLGSLLDSYHKVITPSKALSEALVGHYSLANMPLTIPNYMDLEMVKLKKDPRANANQIRCLNVGSLERIKNQQLLIKKWIELPEQYTLDLIGDGPLHASLTEFIKNENLSSRVKIQKPISKQELLQTYCKYDISVSTSLIETFGMSLLESIAAGVPVVTTCDSGPSTFITTANGKIVTVSRLVETILNTGKNLKSYAPEKVRASVISYDKSEVINSYIQLYQEVTS